MWTVAVAGGLGPRLGHPEGWGVRRDRIQAGQEIGGSGPAVQAGQGGQLPDAFLAYGRKRTSSPTDQDFRTGGHKAAVVVDTDSQLVTAVDILPGNAGDNTGVLELVEQSEENTGIAVEETIGDAAYGDGGTRQAFADAGRTLIAKVPLRSFRATTVRPVRNIRGSRPRKPKAAWAAADQEHPDEAAPGGRQAHLPGAAHVTGSVPRVRTFQAGPDRQPELWSPTGPEPFPASTCPTLPRAVCLAYGGSALKRSAWRDEKGTGRDAP